VSRPATDQEVRLLCRAVRARLDLGLTHSMVESRWTPEQVYHPNRKRKRPFCGREEWEFIAELLEAATPLQVIRLDIPKGADGFVMKVPSRHRPEMIYIKLQLDEDDFVIGRSFHYSDPR
jgi:hypothetical protein